MTVFLIVLVGFAGSPFPDLFISEVASFELKAKPTSVRRRFVKISSPSVHAEGITLNLFSDTELIAMRDHIDERSSSEFSWIGKISGEPFSSVVLTKSEAGWFGGISVGEQRFYIKPVQHDVYELSEDRDEEVHPRGDDMVEIPSESVRPNRPEFPVSNAGIPDDDGSVIDILVAYTSSAESAATTLAGSMSSFLQYVLTIANLAHSNSSTSLRLRIVHSFLSDYTEVGGSLSTDLSRLTELEDGFVDEVHERRETYGADLVYLFEGPSSGSVSGLAYVAQAPNTISYPSMYGFAVSKILTAATLDSNAQTFAHEVGHNLGCAHDRANSNATGAYPYSYGWGQNGGYGTIMSFVGTRINYFSNPDVTVGGVAIGVDENDPNSANNAASMSNMRAEIAAYRAAVVPESATISKSSFAGCFIATATYGSPLEKEVKTLRQFRNDYLGGSRIGRALLRTYYKLSPPLAKLLEKHEGLRQLSRRILSPIIKIIKKTELRFIHQKAAKAK